MQDGENDGGGGGNGRLVVMVERWCGSIGCGSNGGTSHTFNTSHTYRCILLSFSIFFYSGG